MIKKLFVDSRFNAAVDLHRVFRGPRPMTFEEFRKLECKTIINLEVGFFDFLHGRRHEEDQWAERLGVRLVHYPLSDFHAPTVYQVNDLMKTIRVALARGDVYIHCLHGVDRTGFIIAKYRMREMGWSREAAIKEMLELGFHTCSYKKWLREI